MTLFGLDLNATRLRAVAGPASTFPAPVPLEGHAPGLPLCVSLAGGAPEVGSMGLRLCRRLPHLVCQGFLPALGDPAEPGRRWLTGADRLESAGALALALRHTQGVCRAGKGVVLALPDYLTADQVELATALAVEAGLPVLGSLSTSLACALAAFAEQTWFGTAVLLDADDHALTVATLQDAGGQAHLLGGVALPHLGLSAWKARLLNALADACILQSRRDPRDSPAAEQALYDQLDAILDDCKHGRPVNVVFQTDHWYQNLPLQPEDTSAFCAPLARQVLAEVARVFQASWPKGPPRMVLLTAAAGQLPGLLAALQGYMEAWERQAASPAGGTSSEEEDFGEHLLRDTGGEPQAVVVLAADAAARGAHAVAGHFLRGELAPRHLDGAAPLPLPQPPDAGPPRLQFQGQDYALRERTFTLGRQPDCDLVFDRGRYPHLSARHCEILYDPEAFLLRDLSREGTWINDQPVTAVVPLRPGDWVRLGPDGPVLRFLGQADSARPLRDQWSVASGQ
jgi:hypothetical protein